MPQHASTAEAPASAIYDCNSLELRPDQQYLTVFPRNIKDHDVN